MMENPKVSIIVAAYNAAADLPRCLESLLRQTEDSFEIIIVNDGSTDETSTLADRYASLDPRVKTIHRFNGGLSAARNTGLASAIGDYVCFMDSDDWADSKMLASMVSACELTSSNVVVAGIYVDFHDQWDCLVKSESRILPNIVIRKTDTKTQALFDENFINLLGYAWNKLYKRDWLFANGFIFEEGLTLIEDIEFNSRVISAAEAITLIPDTFVHYVQRARKTLGTTYDETFLALQMRAIGCVDNILREYGMGEDQRIERSANSAGMALWMSLRLAGTDEHPADRLRLMLEQPGADELVNTSLLAPLADWRWRWARDTLKRKSLRAALLPIRTMIVFRIIANSFSKRMNF